MKTEPIQNFRKEMTRFFHAYKRKMKINPHWKIYVEVRREQDTFATVEYDYEKKLFWMYVNDKLNGNVRELQDSVIHEFCHIILTPYTSKTEKIITQLSDKRKLTKYFERTEESIVKQLTHILMNWDKHE